MGKNYSSSKIIKDIMHYAGCDNVSLFCNLIGASYMKVYYMWRGTTPISEEVLLKIHNTFPEIRLQYIKGEDNRMLENDESTSNGKSDSQVTMQDMFVLIERLTTLFEKMQESQNKMNEHYMHILELEERLLNDFGNSKNINKPHICG